MEVVLKENIKKLGKAGDVVKVSDGYARNYLIPKGKALQVTEKSLKSIQREMRRRQEKLEKQKEEKAKLLERLKNIEITIKKLASEDDKLFGSVTEKDIADELNELGFSIDKTHIVLNTPIRQLGFYTVIVKLSSDLETKVKVWVVRENKK